MTRRLTIRTDHIRPPIPTRNHDWSAVTDNYEPGHPIGYGPTEADAVMDLYEQLADREADDQDRYDHEMGEA